MLIATLIAAGSLTQERVDATQRLLASAGIAEARWSWLDEGDAGDFAFDAASERLPELRLLLEKGLAGIDSVVQRADTRAKRLLVADMDSTMIGQECIDELADYAGKKDEIAAVTDAAMRGEIDFATALHQRVATLNGLGTGCIARCREERIRPTPGARTLVQTMKARGAGTLLVTGGFHDFADPTAAELGFDEVRANHLDSIHGHLTGLVTGQIVDAAAKCEALIQRRTQMGIDPAAVLAVGDGANDAPMIAEAGLGIAFRGKPKLREIADARIDHGDLTALLWAQGIPRSQWVGA